MNRVKKNTAACFHGRHGFEKESIRINPDGTMASGPHPESLGSSLKHPFISTDFAESQLEFITRPANNISQALRQLKGLHVYTTKKLEGELMWPLSMPPGLPDRDEDIPLAFFGRSASGINKAVYRRGIAGRYGRRRLTISGVHYNYSFNPKWLENGPFERSAINNETSKSMLYFNIIRNFYRRLYYLTYLFGASPAFDRSLDASGIHRFLKHKKSTRYAKYSTSLRLSDIGYTSGVQDGLEIDFNSLEGYTGSVRLAMTEPNPDYLKFVDQLNPNYLQNENEFYAPVRPKNRTGTGEGLLDSLEKNGVGYIEVRMPDIDPEYPEGVDPFTAGFLHLALLEGLLNESPPVSRNEMKEIRANQQAIIWFGRKKGLKIRENGAERLFHEAGREYADGLFELAGIMDRDSGEEFYTESLRRQMVKFESPGQTPSGILLSRMLDCNDEFLDTGCRIAERNSSYFHECALTPECQRELDNETRQSARDQEAVEASEMHSRGMK